MIAVLDQRHTPTLHRLEGLHSFFSFLLQRVLRSAIRASHDWDHNAGVTMPPSGRRQKRTGLFVSLVKLPRGLNTANLQKTLAYRHELGFPSPKLAQMEMVWHVQI